MGPWLTCAEVPMLDIQARSRPWRSTRYVESTHRVHKPPKKFTLFSDNLSFVTLLIKVNPVLTKVILSLCSTSVIRTLRPTGRAALTWRLYRGSMGSPSQTQRCWRSGNVFRRRPRTETIARLAKWVTVGSLVQAHPAGWGLELETETQYKENFDS